MHNIPILTDDMKFDTKLVKEDVLPTRRRHSLIKRRPHSFHVHRPTPQKMASYNGAPSQKGIPTVVTVTSNVSEQDQNKHSDAQPFDSLLVPEKDILHPACPSSTPGSAQSYPSRSSSIKTSGDTKNIVTLTRVSSILSSIFGSNNSDNSPDSRSSMKERLAIRRLSKRVQKQGNSSAKSSQGSTPCQSPGSRSPLILLGELRPEEPTEEITKPVQVFRTSGIFGIRDDGSEDYDAQEHEQAHAFSSTGFKSIPERAGSPHTQSDGVRRILYVENHVEEQDDRYKDNGQEKAEEVLFRTPLGPEGPVENQTEGDATVNPSQQTLTTDDVLGSSHDASFSPSVAHHASSSSHSSTVNGYDRSFSLQHVLVTTSPDGRHSATHTTPGMFDESIPTSLPPSPALSPHPSSETPAFQTLASVQPQIPIPPSSSGSLTFAQDSITLGIASHLLSAHAKALLKYSSTIKDTGEAMHKMAEESLEWGNVLMRLAGKVENEDTTTSRERDNNLGGLHRSGTPLMFDGHRRSTSVYSHGKRTTTKEVRDDHMRAAGLSTRPYGNDPSQDRKRRGVSLPTSMLSELHELGALGLMNVHKAEETWRNAIDHLAEVMEKGQGAQKGQEVPVDRQTAVTNGLNADATTGSVSEMVEPSPAIASSYPGIHYDAIHQQNSFYGHPLDPYSTLRQREVKATMEHPSVHAYAAPENWAVAPASPTVPQVADPGNINEQLQLQSPSHHAPIFHELSSDIKFAEAINNKQSGSNITAASGTALGRGGMWGKAVAGSKVEGRKLKKVQEQGSGFSENGTLNKKKHWWSRRSSIIS